MAIIVNCIKYILLLLASAFILVMLFCYLAAAGIGETTVYRQSDFFSYHCYTDEEIGGAPRISPFYSFEYHSGDGYASSNAIIFKRTRALTPLRDYLRRLGYQREPTLHAGEQLEVWSKPEAPGVSFSLSISGEDEVTLMKILG